jgi:DNA-binding NarL/FixJ family response regulator
LVEKIPGIEVVAEASDRREAIAQVTKYLPDIALMDIAMPNLNGLAAAARIVKNFPEVKVIVLSAYANEEYVLQALRSGVSGYLLKEASLEELQLALKAVGHGETFLSPAVSKAVINSYLGAANVGSGLMETLTPRQREILQLLAEGKKCQRDGFSVEFERQDGGSTPGSNHAAARYPRSRRTGPVRHSCRLGNAIKAASNPAYFSEKECGRSRRWRKNCLLYAEYRVSRPFFWVCTNPQPRIGGK